MSRFAAVKPSKLLHILLIILGYFCVKGLQVGKTDPPPSGDTDGRFRLREDLPPLRGNPSQPSIRESGSDSSERQGTSLVSRSLLSRMDVNLFNPITLELRKSVCEHMNLSSSQEEEINAEILNFFSNLRILESETAIVPTSDSGEQFIKIPPYPEAKPLAEAFAQRIADIISDDSRGLDFGRLLSTNPRLGGIADLPQELAVVSQKRPDGSNFYFVQRVLRDHDGNVAHESITHLRESSPVWTAYERVFEHDIDDKEERKNRNSLAP